MIQQNTNPTSRWAETFMIDAIITGGLLYKGDTINNAKITQQASHNIDLVFCKENKVFYGLEIAESKLCSSFSDYL